MNHSYIIGIDVSSDKCDIDIHMDNNQERGSLNNVRYTHSELSNMLLLG